jgi:hypothetical protein
MIPGLVSCSRTGDILLVCTWDFIRYSGDFRHSSACYISITEAIRSNSLLFNPPNPSVTTPSLSTTLPLNPTNHFANPAANQARIDTLAGLGSNATDEDIVHIYVPALDNIEDLLSLTLDQLIINNSTITGDVAGGWIEIPDIHNPDEKILVPLIPPHPGVGTNPGDIPGTGVGTGTGAGAGAGTEADWEQLLRELTGIGTGITGMNARLLGIQTGVQALPLTIADSLAGFYDIQSNQRIRNPLTTVFPFSIPFSLAAAISSLNAPPKTPRWELDFTGTVLSGSYWGGSDEGSTIVIDLAELESVVRIIRWGLALTFGFGLLMLTRKMITW